jgi:hypothetical protein
MCDKCVELDRKIEHYRRLASRFTDQALLDGIRGLIERAEVEKAVLHPGSNAVMVGDMSCHSGGGPRDAPLNGWSNQRSQDMATPTARRAADRDRRGHR